MHALVRRNETTVLFQQPTRFVRAFWCLYTVRPARATALHAIPRLPAGNTTTELPDLVDIVHAIGRLWVLRFDVQVEVSPERRGCEGLTTKWAGSVFGGLDSVVLFLLVAIAVVVVGVRGWAGRRSRSIRVVGHVAYTYIDRVSSRSNALYL